MDDFDKFVCPPFVNLGFPLTKACLGSLATLCVDVGVKGVYVCECVSPSLDWRPVQGLLLSPSGENNE